MCTLRSLLTMLLYAHLRITRASGEEQSDPAGRILVKKRQECLFHLAARPLDSALALLLQREPVSMQVSALVSTCK